MDIGEVRRRAEKLIIAWNRGWWRQGRRNVLGDGSDTALRKNDASRVTSGLCLVLVVVPFIETRGTGRGSGLSMKITKLMVDIM